MLATRALHLHVTPGALIAFLLLFGSIYVLGAPKNPESSLTPSRGDLVLSETIKPRALPFPPREKPEDSEDSEEPESEESEEPEDPKKPIDYAAVCRKGALANAYLQSDDETVLSDLLHKGRLPPGSQLASRFTDYAQLSSNGWDGNDDTERLDSLDLCEYIPFLDALQALGISTKPRTDGMLELWGYEHNLPWTRHDGKRVEVRTHRLNQKAQKYTTADFQF